MKKKGSKKQKRREIKNRIRYTVILIVVTGMIGLGIVTSYLNFQNTITTLQDNMSLAVELAADRIYWEITAYQRIAIDLGMVAQMSDEDYTDEQKQELINQKVQECGLVRGKLISMDGIAHIDGTDYSDRDYFKKSMQGETSISEPLISKSSGELSIIISAPVWKGGVVDSEVVGVVFIAPQETFLNDIVKNIQISTNGSAYMIDANGNTIAHKNMDLVENKSNTQEDAKTDSSQKRLAELEKKMTQGESGFGLYSYGGVQKLMTYAPISGVNGWSVAVNAPLSDFMQGTINCILLTILFVIAAIALAIWRIEHLANAIATPLKKVSARLTTFAQGDLSTEFPCSDEDNEIKDMIQEAAQMSDGLKTIINDCKYRLGEMAQGNFTIESTMEEKYKGEFADLNIAINQLNQKLNDTLHRIKEVADQVSVGSNNMAEGAQSLADGATEQAGAVQEILATVTSVTDGVALTSTRVGEVKEISVECANEAQQNRLEMNNMVKGMLLLSETSQKIENIIGEIEDIASQTNLLALNASIEAARAGEVGRGFAVVAQQIGKLAEESAKSADNTRELILDSVNKIKDESLAAEKAAETINVVVEKINQLSKSAEEINQYTIRQAEEMKQVEDGVTQIAEVIQSNSATAEESSATSEELAAEANSMDEMINRFKLK